MNNVVCIHRAQGGWRPNSNAGEFDYSSTNAAKKNLYYYIFQLYDKLNGFSYKYLGFGISKGKR